MDDRRVVNAMVFKARTGIAWRDLPDRYGPRNTVYTRFRRWALDGTFDRMVTALQSRAELAGAVDWVISVDSTITRVHQHATTHTGGRPARHGAE